LGPAVACFVIDLRAAASAPSGPDPTLAIGDRGLRWFALAFALTQLVEVPIFAPALRGGRDPRSPRPLLARVAIAFGASALTHPVVWFVMPLVAVAILTAAARVGIAVGAAGGALVYGALAEGFAVLVEAAYLRAFGVRRALLWSLGANTASVVVGTAVVWGLG
jgi:hypothetical protein